MLDGRLQPRNLYAVVRVAILSGILFFSGIGSLIFETLWLRLSGLTFGNSVWSAALILSSFMAGLALGLRTPVLEALGSDEFRLAIAESAARKSEIPPTETIPDLVAGALARRDFNGAIVLLESQKELGVFDLNDLFLLAHISCVSGEVRKSRNACGQQRGINQEGLVRGLVVGKIAG